MQNKIFETKKEETEPKQHKERKIMEMETVMNDMNKIEKFMINNKISKENVKIAYDMFKPLSKYFLDGFLENCMFNKFEDNIRFGMDNEWEELAMEIKFCSDRMTYERMTKILINFNNMKDRMNEFKSNQEIVKGDTRSDSGDII